MKTIVIYHANCWDGFCAAWLLSKAFPDAEFHAANYGTDPPDVAGNRVFIVDFSYKRPVMRQILSSAHFVTVLDHHRTAEQELSGLVDEFMMRPDLIANPVGSELPEIVFDMSKSGGRLAWEYVYGKKLLPDEWLATNKSGYSIGVAPWLVDYTEDRDLWSWKLDRSKAINAGLRSYPLEFKEWDSIRDDPNSQSRLATEGAAILRREQQIINDHIRHAREITLDGHEILCVNATVLFSEIAGELANGRPFGACYFDRNDGKRQWSLRSTDDGIDVAEIALRHGGGGHPHASGFEEPI